ncbi:MAG: class I SAM-dependent methyltransferase [Chlamydiales bacterium]|nr:class I SAM-dependent methyltransferase [Chlamydiales bacterium]
MSYYKFAAKMIGGKKRVLDVGCNEGLEPIFLAKECNYALGIDQDAEAISFAKQNFSGELIDFEKVDFLHSDMTGEWDAVTSFDLIGNIAPELAESFIGKIASFLKEDGVAVIGTPSKVSQELSSLEQPNLYDHERLEEEMQKHFRHVFMFAANDEVVHTGYMPLAHYFIVVACGPKC